MSEEIQEYMTELQNIVISASLSYDVWWVFKGYETRSAYLKTMNQHPTFFYACIHSHFVALLIALYSLYETRKDTHNIPRMIYKIKNLEGVTPYAVARLNELYERARPLWVKVSVLRNNAYAHRSDSMSVPDVFAEAGVKPDELKELVDITKDLLNEANSEVFSTEHAFNLDARGSTIEMLDALRKFYGSSPS
jgi:hypothetical protein